MAKSEIEPLAPTLPATATAPIEEAVNTYRMSGEGRRRAFVLLLGAASIWVFALWTLITILENGITGVEWVSLLLMLGILIVAPMVGWTLLEEANSRFSTGDWGIRYATFGGVDVTYGWDDLVGAKERKKSRLARFFLGDDTQSENVREVKADVVDENSRVEEDPGTLLFEVRRAGRIANPLVRFLHRMAYGDALPIFGGLENRSALLGEIASRLETR